MKLNCDMAEGAGCEAALMPYLDQANIACGAHAGGPELMRSIVALARQHDVSIGAHPGYPDWEHFGRESLSARCSWKLISTTFLLPENLLFGTTFFIKMRAQKWYRKMGPILAAQGGLFMCLTRSRTNAGPL